MERCVDGCKYLNKRWNRDFCDCEYEFVENKGRFCKKFKPETWWSKFLKEFFGL